MLKEERLLEAVRQRAAEFCAQESNRTSLITVTRAISNSDRSKITVLFTAIPTNKEAEVLTFLKRRRADLRAYLGERLRIFPVPFVDVDIDLGEKNRQRLDELSL